MTWQDGRHSDDLLLRGHFFKMGDDDEEIEKRTYLGLKVDFLLRMAGHTLCLQYHALQYRYMTMILVF